LNTNLVGLTRHEFFSCSSRSYTRMLNADSTLFTDFIANVFDAESCYYNNSRILQPLVSRLPEEADLCMFSMFVRAGRKRPKSLITGNIYRNHQTKITNAVTKSPNKKQQKSRNVASVNRHYVWSCTAVAQHTTSNRRLQSGSEVVHWLHLFYGLSFLQPHDVSGAFAFDITSCSPASDKCDKFGYVYVTNVTSPHHPHPIPLFFTFYDPLVVDTDISDEKVDVFCA